MSSKKIHGESGDDALLLKQQKEKVLYKQQFKSNLLERRQGMSFIGRSLVIILVALLLIYIGLQTFFLLQNRFYALNEAHSAYIAGTAYVAFGGNDFDEADGNYFYITDYKKLYERYRPAMKGTIKVVVGKEDRKVLYAYWTKTEKKQLIDYFWQGYARWPQEKP